MNLNFLRTSAHQCIGLPYRVSPEPVSSVHQVRHRQLREELKELADQLSGEKVVSPVQTGNQIVQALALAAILLRQHQVNDRGQCKFCTWPRWKWKFWSRRPLCTVYRTAGFVMSQELDEVWWQLLDSLGKECDLVEIRGWIKEKKLDSSCTVCGQHIG